MPAVLVVSPLQHVNRIEKKQQHTDYSKQNKRYTCRKHTHIYIYDMCTWKCRCFLFTFYLQPTVNSNQCKTKWQEGNAPKKLSKNLSIEEYKRHRDTGITSIVIFTILVLPVL
jgi:hypothetical protein